MPRPSISVAPFGFLTRCLYAKSMAQFTRSDGEVFGHRKRGWQASAAPLYGDGRLYGAVNGSLGANRGHLLDCRSASPAESLGGPARDLRFNFCDLVAQFFRHGFCVLGHFAIFSLKGKEFLDRCRR